MEGFGLPKGRPTVRTINYRFYCRSCLVPIVDGACPLCTEELRRSLVPLEEIRKRAIMKVLDNHRAELIHTIEIEKTINYEET